MVSKFDKNNILDMGKKIQKFIKENKRTPNYVTTKNMAGNTVQLRKPDYNGLFESTNRFYIRNGRLPNYVSLVTTANNPLVLDTQDTTYTCGPTSLSMAIQLLYGFDSENKMKEYCKTTKNGTSPSDLISGAKKAGYLMKQIERSTRGVKKSLDACKPVIAHIDTLSEHCLGYKKSKNWGHYILLWGLDGSKYKVADPTKGLKVVNATCINEAMYKRVIGFYSVEIL